MKIIKLTLFILHPENPLFTAKGLYQRLT